MALRWAMRFLLAMAAAWLVTAAVLTYQHPDRFDAVNLILAGILGLAVGFVSQQAKMTRMTEEHYAEMAAMRDRMIDVNLYRAAAGTLRVAPGRDR